jgi:hypothetical protein
MTYVPSLPGGAVLLDVFRAYPDTARPLLDYHQAQLRGRSRRPVPGSGVSLPTLRRAGRWAAALKRVTAEHGRGRTAVVRATWNGVVLAETGRPPPGTTPIPARSPARSKTMWRSGTGSRWTGSRWAAGRWHRGRAAHAAPTAPGPEPGPYRMPRHRGADR